MSSETANGGPPGGLLGGLLNRLSWRPAHCALLLLAHARLIASGARAGGWDWYDFIYPWADALRLSILKYHQFPWWNPWSMSGQPFFAEPQTAVLMPDTLLLLAGGAVVGYKLVILFYAFVGYEGSRFLCRHLFGGNRFVEGVAIIPALLPPLALHLGVGHAVLISFWLFPWLLGLSLTWSRSAGRSLAFGAVIGCFFLTYIHYSLIIGFSIAGAIVLRQLSRSYRSREIRIKAALVVCTALGLGLTRLALTGAFISDFPRAETEHYPIVASLGQVLQTLVDPRRRPSVPLQIGDLGYWELGSYVGVLVLLLAGLGLWRGERRLRALHVGALLCLVFAWNNRDKFLPGYWMHVTPPWKYMVIITRWRLFGCYLLLVGAVQGLVAIRARRGAWIAACLAALVILDLGFHIDLDYRGAFVRQPPPWTAAPDPPRTVRDRPVDVWQHLRMNLVSMGAEFPLLGWHDHSPKRDHLGTPTYRGDFVGTQPVRVEVWTPNRVVLTGAPGDTLTINVNPSSYWLVNGERLFSTYRAMEPAKPFRVPVPPGGRIELLARPPHLGLLIALQAAFALLAALLFRWTRRAAARVVDEPLAMGECSAADRREPRADEVTPP